MDRFRWVYESIGRRAMADDFWVNQSAFNLQYWTNHKHIASPIAVCHAGFPKRFTTLGYSPRWLTRRGMRAAVDGRRSARSLYTFHIIITPHIIWKVQNTHQRVLVCFNYFNRVQYASDSRTWASHASVFDEITSIAQRGIIRNTYCCTPQNRKQRKINSPTHLSIESEAQMRILLKLQ